MASLPPLPVRQRRRYGIKCQTSADLDSFRRASEMAHSLSNNQQYSRTSQIPHSHGSSITKTVPRASILNDISVNSINYPRVGEKMQPKVEKSQKINTTSVSSINCPKIVGKIQPKPEYKYSKERIFDTEQKPNLESVSGRRSSLGSTKATEIGSEKYAYNTIKSNLRSGKNNLKNEVKDSEKPFTVFYTKDATARRATSTEARKTLSTLTAKADISKSDALIQETGVAQSGFITQHCSEVEKNDYTKSVPDVIKSAEKEFEVSADESKQFKDLINQHAKRGVRVYQKRSVSDKYLSGSTANVTTVKLSLQSFKERSNGMKLIELSKECDKERLKLFITNCHKNESIDCFINFTDERGKTALYYAVTNNDLELVKELTKVKSIDPNVQDFDGNTCLHIAAQGGYSEIVNVLTLTKGIQLDTRNNLGLTPLMKAAIQGKARSARILLVAGALSELRDPRRNFTAEEWAMFCGRKLCADMIRKFIENMVKGSPGKLKWSSEPDLKTSKLTRSISFVGKVWKTVTGAKVEPRSTPIKRQLSVSAELTRIGITTSMTSLPDLVPKELEPLRLKLIIPRIEISFWSPAMATIIPPPPTRSPPKLQDGEATAGNVGKSLQRKSQSNPQLYTARSKGVLDVKFPVDIRRK
ncbi:uncharacterized protein LOC136033622 isoform X2 [Artemia franciscana]|uniref:Ankyrin repeat domain-containing protein 33B n=1 Tax=Artemia franciscana TaxID=6661 RepID=A0AA88I7M9_ARTSF|nr:hypothetical protein QYM36_001871 [Artemia franciscana]